MCDIYAFRLAYHQHKSGEDILLHKGEASHTQMEYKEPHL